MLLTALDEAACASYFHGAWVEQAGGVMDDVWQALHLSVELCMCMRLCLCWYLCYGVTLGVSLGSLCEEVICSFLMTFKLA